MADLCGYLSFTTITVKLVKDSVDKTIEKERQYQLHDMSTYLQFSCRVKQMKLEILQFFINMLTNNKTIAGYGAPAKGNTLLNYCGITSTWLPYTVDQNPHKQGLYLPGSRIPIRKPDELKQTKLDYVLILPWNLKDEIVEEYAYIRDWSGKFVVLVPKVEMLIRL